MLKHRYNTLSESLSDFDRMLDGMNSVQPLERKIDEDLLDLYRDEQALVRLEQQIEHVHRAIYGSGMPISEAESESIRKMHAHAAAMYNETADRAAARIKELDAEGSEVRAASLARMKEFHDKLRRKADAHAAAASGPAKKKEMTASVNESVRSSASSRMAVYRRLAGIDESVQMPRDPGLLGTTRSNAEYEQMAQPFDEGGGSRASKPERQGKAQQAHMDKHGTEPVMTTGGHVRNWKSDLRYGMDKQGRDSLTDKMRGKNFDRFGQAWDDKEIVGRDEEKETVAQYQARGGEIKKVPPGEAANSMTFGQDITKKGTTKALAAQTWGAQGHRQSMKLGRHESGDDPAPKKRGLAPRPGLHHGEKNPRPRQELVPRPGLHHGEKNPRPDPERQSESLSIEDRIREIREGRSKAQQDKGHYAMSVRSDAFHGYDHDIHPELMRKAKEHGQDPDRAWSVDADRRNIRAGGKDPLAGKRGGGERLRRFRADKSMGAEKAAEKQAAEKYRKTMAWYKARNDAETGQTPPKVMPIPGPKPGEKATKSEGLSIEDRIREIREARSKKDHDAGLKKSTIDAAKVLDARLKKKGAGAEIGTDGDARPRINQATTKAAAHAKGDVGSEMARASKRAISREIVGQGRYDRLADRAGMKADLEPGDYTSYLRRTIKKDR